jgi:hypothetical protein
MVGRLSGEAPHDLGVAERLVVGVGDIGSLSERGIEADQVVGCNRLEELSDRGALVGR